MTETRSEVVKPVKAIDKIMSLVVQYAAQSDIVLDTTEKTYAYETLNMVQKRIIEDGESWNTVAWQECNLPGQIKRFCRLGLSIDRNEIYIDLRKNKNARDGKKDINLRMQYQGEQKLLLKYCTKGGGIKNFYQDVVMAGEEVEYQRDLKTGGILIASHKIANPFDRGCTYANRDKCIGAYAIAYHKDGSQTVVTIGKDRIERARKASAATSGVVWSNDFQKMVLKTAVHELYKELAVYNVIPDDIVTDMASGMLDESRREIAENAMQGEIIDVTVNIPEEKPEPAEAPKAPGESPESAPEPDAEPDIEW